jgi:hypothetical protein
MLENKHMLNFSEIQTLFQRDCHFSFLLYEGSSGTITLSVIDAAYIFSHFHEHCNSIWLGYDSFAFFGELTASGAHV